ncbi:hypothetical protein BH10PAT3_BH10PAT3_4930 [soil metagenome]
MSEKTTNHRKRNALLAAVAVLSLSALIPATTDGGLKHAGKHPIDLSDQGKDVEGYAKSMQDTLNNGEPAKGVTILLHNELDINPDAQKELGIDKIYVPMNMGGGKYGYAKVDQETGKVSIGLVDMADGTLVQPDLSGKFETFVGDVQVQNAFGGEGKVLAVTDPLQMFVGQADVHTEG